MTQPKLKLYTYPGNKNAYKALIAAQYVSVDIEVPSDFQFGVTNKTPEFLKLNPNGKVILWTVPLCKPAASNADDASGAQQSVALSRLTRRLRSYNICWEAAGLCVAL